MPFMHWLRAGILLTVTAGVKALAVFESALLYRIFLQLTATLLAFFGNAEYSEDAGVYTFPHFILDYSCAGINFFAVAMLTGLLVMLSSGRVRLWLLPAAWLLTVLANTMRVGLYLKLEPWAAGREWLHEAVGVLTFLTLLIVYYLLLQRILYGKKHQTA